MGKVGTEFEQLVGKLFQLDEDPSEYKRFCLVLCFIVLFYLMQIFSYFLSSTDNFIAT